MAEKHIDNHYILEKVLVIFKEAVEEAVGEGKTDNDNDELRKQLRNLSTNLNKEMLEGGDEYMNPEEIKNILKKMMD
tara:strand:+ start:3977 stop:4207 length:231 start_codon:yes stop_codon:yes gene_type:complete